ETHDRAHRQNPLQGGGVVHETMEYSSHTSGEPLHLLENRVQGIALMYDAVQPKLGRHFQLLFENRRLLSLVLLVVSLGKFRFLAGQMVIIQACFPHRHELRMHCQFAQSWPKVVWRFTRITRMPSSHGENIRVGFSEF